MPSKFEFSLSRDVEEVLATWMLKGLQFAGSLVTAYLCREKARDMDARFFLVCKSTWECDE